AAKPSTSVERPPVVSLTRQCSNCTPGTGERYGLSVWGSRKSEVYARSHASGTERTSKYTPKLVSRRQPNAEPTFSTVSGSVGTAGNMMNPSPKKRSSQEDGSSSPGLSVHAARGRSCSVPSHSWTGGVS